MAELQCPGCGRSMRAVDLERAPLLPVTVDLCDDCQALWLDATESQQLTPGAVIALFRLIAASRPASRTPFPALLPCPRCTTPLTLTQDVQQTTHFTYYRCRHGHGRFTPFVQFLREKRFIRAVDPAELAHLRALVSTVRCVSCGAPVPLDRDAVCPYCGAPVMLLDPNAVSQALARLDSAEVQRKAPQPLTGDGVLAIANVERELERDRNRSDAGGAVDVVELGIRALTHLFAR